ncbi:hypothetical protein B6D60_03600 [candidate division KSB1 bacterium 4484_87]|nr:MAG: hypothetical protein B6D60_03600 [candidate division KSB1 bacterium 4484_87]
MLNTFGVLFFNLDFNKLINWGCFKNRFFESKYWAYVPNNIHFANFDTTPFLPSNYQKFRRFFIVHYEKYPKIFMHRPNFKIFHFFLVKIEKPQPLILLITKNKSTIFATLHFCMMI